MKPWACLLGLSATACTGYGELPLPVREQGTLEVEALDLYPGDVGRVQVKLVLESDDPWLMVSNPTYFEANLLMVGWAHGTCPGLGEPDADPTHRLCIGTYWEASAAVDTLTLGLVVQRVSDGQRFTVFGGSEP